MKFFGTFLLALIVGVLYPSPADSHTNEKKDAFEEAMDKINSILDEKNLSPDERDDKIATVTGELSKAMNDINLTPEEAKKISGPLSAWVDDLRTRIEDIHAENGEVKPEDLNKAIDESIVNRPELGTEIGNILKSKDKKRVGKLFSNMASSAKRLAHKLKEKIKSGWKKR